jgi:hypothetical protein
MCVSCPWKEYREKFEKKMQEQQMHRCTFETRLSQTVRPVVMADATVSLTERMASAHVSVLHDAGVDVSGQALG